jgi:hypothetical protein
VTSGHHMTKQLKLWPYQFQAVPQLQEFNIFIGFVILCMKGFMCNSYDCILNEALYCSYNNTLQFALLHGIN